MIAFLGTGLLGSNFTRSLLSKGHQVQVWNRTASKAKALENYGAKAFSEASAAVNGAAIVHLTLKDDPVVNEVLANATQGAQPGTIFIDHSTTSVEGCTERTAQLKAQGFQYLHAPVFMGPQAALEATGHMLVSGDQELISQLTPYLSKITGTLVNLGPETGKGAGMKLVGNLFLLTLSTGMMDMLALAQSFSIGEKEVADFINVWNPGPSLAGRVNKIMDANYSEPSWELHMARKDAGIMLDSAARASKELNYLPAIARVMDKYISEGHATDDWTVISKDQLSK